MDSGGGVEENPPSRDLVIRNVSQEVEGDLRTLLKEFGTITSFTMSPLNMAMVQFKDLEAAKSAKSALKDCNLHGNPLKLEFPKTFDAVKRNITRRKHVLNFQLVVPLPVTQHEIKNLQEYLANIIAREESITADEIKITGGGGEDEDDTTPFQVACEKAIDKGHLLIARGQQLVEKAHHLLFSTTTHIVAPVGEDKR